MCLRVFVCVYVCMYVGTQEYMHAYICMHVCMHVYNIYIYGCARVYICLYVRLHVCIIYTHTYEMKIFRTFRAGARFSSKFSRRWARERNFIQNFQDAPHGSAIFIEILKMLRTRARFFSNFSGRSARERDFSQRFQDAPHGSTILIIRERSGADHLSIELYRHVSLENQNFDDKSGESYTRPIPKHTLKKITLGKMNRRNFEDVSSGTAILQKQLIKYVRTLCTGARF